MYTDISIPFFFQFLYFLFASFIAFYIPGRVLTKKFSFSAVASVALALGVGLCMWGWQGFLFGYTNIRWMSYIYLFVFFLLWIKTIPRFLPTIRFSLDKTIFSIILIGVLVQCIPVWTMGIRFPNGIHMCCGQVPDNILELALTNEIVHRIPPNEPGMYGSLLQNYHYWSHMVMGETVRIFGLPLTATVYQFFPLLMSALLGMLAISFAQLLRLRKTFTAWLLFFLYFGGDFNYGLLLLLGKGLNFSLSAMESGATFFLNIPRAFSIVIFFAALNMFILWVRKKNFQTGVLLSLLSASLIGFKVYTGAFMAVGLCCWGIYQILRRQYLALWPILFTGILALIIYLPVNKSAGGFFFTGFWRVNDFIVLPLLGLSHLELAREIYSSHHNWLRVFLYEVLFTCIFIVGIFGTKLLGFFQSKKSMKMIQVDLHILLLSGMAVSFILGMFFWQKTGGANSFNFLVSVFIIGSIYTALSVSTLQTRLKGKVLTLFVGVVIFFTLPRVLVYTGQTFTYIHNTKPFISNDELSALLFLRSHTNPNALILVGPNINLDMLSPYVTYFADRPVYLSGKGADLGEHGISYADRQQKVTTILSSGNRSQVKSLLTNEKITYMYLPTNDLLPMESFGITKKIFENREIKILQVDTSPLQ